MYLYISNKINKSKAKMQPATIAEDSKIITSIINTDDINTLMKKLNDDIKIVNDKFKPFSEIKLKRDDKNLNLIDVINRSYNIQDFITNVINDKKYDDNTSKELIEFSKNIECKGVSLDNDIFSFNYSINKIPLSLSRYYTISNGDEYFIFGDMICSSGTGAFEEDTLYAFYETLNFKYTDIYTFLDFIYYLFVEEIGNNIFYVDYNNFGYWLFIKEKKNKKLSQISLLKYKFPDLYEKYKLDNPRIDIELTNKTNDMERSYMYKNYRVSFEYFINDDNGRKILFNNDRNPDNKNPNSEDIFYSIIVKRGDIRPSYPYTEDNRILNTEPYKEFYNILFSEY